MFLAKLLFGGLGHRGQKTTLLYEESGFGASPPPAARSNNHYLPEDVCFWALGFPGIQKTTLPNNYFGIPLLISPLTRLRSPHAGCVNAAISAKALPAVMALQVPIGPCLRAERSMSCGVGFLGFRWGPDWLKIKGFEAPPRLPRSNSTLPSALAGGPALIPPFRRASDPAPDQAGAGLKPSIFRWKTTIMFLVAVIVLSLKQPFCILVFGLDKELTTKWL